MAEEANRWEGVNHAHYAALLSERLGNGYRLVKSVDHEHRTPWGSGQRFHFGLFRKA